MIKALFLDWYKTLSSSTFWEHLSSENPKSHRIINKAYLNLGNEIERWMRGRNDVKSIVKTLSEDTGLDYSYLINELKISAEQMTFDSDQFIPLIQKIRSNNVKVFIATDNMDTFDMWTVPSLNLDKLFDGVLNSYGIGYLKNDISDDNYSLFFGNLFDELSIEPSATLIIDDNKPNKIVASGMNYHRVQNPEDVIKGLKSVQEYL